jgi:hypothetical protein
MSKNFTCSLKAWISEQNACTLNDISDRCGSEAEAFYADLQSSIFDANYPFVCDRDPSTHYLATTTPKPTPKIAKTESAGLFTV